MADLAAYVSDFLGCPSNCKSFELILLPSATALFVHVPTAMAAVVSFDFRGSHVVVP